MVGWWPGDEHTNDIIDANHGTLVNGASYTPGMVGPAFALDGIDDHILVPASSNLNITGDVTVDLWAKRTTFGYAYMAAKGNVTGPLGTAGSSVVFHLGFHLNDDLVCGYYTASGGSFGVHATAITDSEFHHYACVRSGNTVKIFLDGVEVSDHTFTEGPGDTAAYPMVIGAIRTELDASGFLGHFGGIIDEVEVFDRALSAAEILAIYEAGAAGKIKP